MIIVTQENKAVCEKCGLTIILDKIEYIQGQVPLLSRVPDDWTVIKHGLTERTFCHKHKIEIQRTKLSVDGEVFTHNYQMP